MQDLQIEYSNQRKLLSTCMDSLKILNRKSAYTEYEYRLSLTQESLRLKIMGYEGELGKTEPVAWTKADVIAMGLPVVAELRLKRDLAKGDVETLMQKIYQIKIEINSIEKEIEATRKGV